jgi:NAD(P)-dependent dehydrogenase (short-subunit alcohol dehydrogenase family)
MQIHGSGALITGGASGLGLATARALAAAGAHVTLLDLPSSAGSEMAAELGGTFAPGDVTSPEDAAAAVAAANQNAPLRIVVNCAGIAPPAKVLDREGNPAVLADFERIVRINLVGTFNVISQASAVIAKNDPSTGSGDGSGSSGDGSGSSGDGSGSSGDGSGTGDGDRGVIINTASVAAFDGQIGQPAYSASKGGVHAMTLPIARELARYGIRVCTIAPGIMETPMLAGLPEAAQESLGQQVPYPARLGRPTEYAALAQSIIENGYLNGETIRLDGAIRMAPK